MNLFFSFAEELFCSCTESDEKHKATNGGRKKKTSARLHEGRLLKKSYKYECAADTVTQHTDTNTRMTTTEYGANTEMMKSTKHSQCLQETALTWTELGNAHWQSISVWLASQIARCHFVLAERDLLHCLFVLTATSSSSSTTRNAHYNINA